MSTAISILADMADTNAFDALSKSYLRCVAELADMPKLLDSILDAIPEANWHRQPAAGGFSVVEHVLHLHNIDLEGYRTRVERILTELEPALSDVDGSKLAEQRSYQKQDVRAARLAFAIVRRELVARLAALGPTERQRAGILEGVGPVTIERLVAVMCRHDREHLAELSQLRNEMGGT